MKQATREAYGKALAELGQKNERIVVMDADLSKSTKTADFAAVCPERFFNAGIAEQNMTGVAAGLAACGKIPFISSFAVFAAGRNFEQIRNSIAYPKLNVKIAATHAGITVGEDGGSHQAIEDISLMRSLPNMTVVVPCDGIETAAAVNALAELDGPCYLRLGRLAAPMVNGEDYKFELGKGIVLRDGKDAAIIACGMMVAPALEAAEALAAEGIDAAVINIHTIKPFDKELVLEYAERCGAVITVEEHSIIGGLGSAVAEAMSEAGVGILGRVGLQDCFGQSGTPAALLEKYGLTPAGIVKKVQETVAKKR
ncbi:MAG: transketolase family protein [Firmicutes bacterium]|nr:transketolase family protein [Bacillota bacterium]